MWCQQNCPNSQAYICCRHTSLRVGILLFLYNILGLVLLFITRFIHLNSLPILYISINYPSLFYVLSDLFTPFNETLFIVQLNNCNLYARYVLVVEECVFFCVDGCDWVRFSLFLHANDNTIIFDSFLKIDSWFSSIERNENARQTWKSNRFTR